MSCTLSNIKSSEHLLISVGRDGLKCVIFRYSISAKILFTITQWVKETAGQHDNNKQQKRYGESGGDNVSPGQVG